MNSPTIGIIGYGYVGKAVYNFLKDHYKIVIYDPNLKYETTQTEINSTCDYAFICVPTPPNADGSCDISIVEDSISWISVPNVVIKSTVEPGTTARLSVKYNKDIVFSPEYAGENKYWSPHKFMTDMKECPFYIFGGNPKLCENFVNLYQKVVGPDKTYHITDSTTAETVKYIENSFYATKVVFCNEIYNLCEKAGVSYNRARELWLLDPRMNKSFTCVFPENRGFGGKCFPKDVSAFAKYGDKVGSELTILKTVIDSNNHFKK